MTSLRMRQYLAPLAALAYLCSFMVMPVANAGVIGTQTMMEHNTHQAKVAEVQQLLSDDAVQQQMIALGVDPAEAKLRVASLTTAELAQIEGHMRDLPAGGSALAVIGIVFLVLLILELVGVINVFSGV